MAQKVEPLSVDTWSVSCSNTLTVNHQFTIKNFSYHCKKASENFLESSVFWPKCNNKYRWRLRVYPSVSHTLPHDYETYCDIYLYCLVEGPISQVLSQFKLHVLTVNNEKKHSIEATYTFQPNSEWGTQSILQNDILKNSAELLPDDKLTIFCEMVILEEIGVISGEPTEIQALENPMNNNFGLLLESQYFSDVTLTVGGKPIKAHKAILATQSPVFQAMFKHDMKEQLTNCVEVDDIDHEVFMEMLRFIYTNEAPNLEKMAIKLLAAADKYNLERLKSMCAKELHKSISTKNVLDILVLSHLHSSEQLKAMAMNFICKNFKDVVETVNFKQLYSLHPDLMTEALCAVATKIDRITVIHGLEKTSLARLSNANRNSRRY